MWESAASVASAECEGPLIEPNAEPLSSPVPFLQDTVEAHFSSSDNCLLIIFSLTVCS